MEKSEEMDANASAPTETGPSETEPSSSLGRRRRGFFAKLIRAVRRKLHRSSDRWKWYRDDMKAIADHGYSCKEITGAGTFGIVYKARPIQNPNQIVAVKRIELDDEFETREIDIHRLTKHQNVVGLLQHWAQSAHKGRIKKFHIYLVLEYMPRSLDDHIHERVRDHCTMPTTLIKLFMYQLFRALNYLHMIRILHRDIKPSNLLVNTEMGVLKICDFGCAKRIKRRGGFNRTYICSRYYRAPELVLQNPGNDETIDLWAAACVMAECFRGWPLFPGKSSEHQFGAIADVLGNPSPYEIRQLNPTVTRMHVKIREASGTFDQHFPLGTPDAAINLLSKILIYRPRERPSALAACADPYYDTLRLKTTVLPSGAPLPPLFDFTALELRKAPAPLVRRLLLGENDTIQVPEPPPQARPNGKEKSFDTVSTESDIASSEGDLFSELPSADVDENDVWDCAGIRVLDDEFASTSSE